MNKTNWVRLARWYTGLTVLQQWLAKGGLSISLLCCIIIVTHEPKERPRQAHSILDCYEGCGSDPARTISHNEYIDRKQQQQTWFREAKQQIQQDIWNENGHQQLVS